MLHCPRITLTRLPVSLATGIGCSMVPLIQLKMVLLAPIAAASIAVAVIVNPGFLRSCRRAKRASWSSPVMTVSLWNIALGESEYCPSYVHAVCQSTSSCKSLATSYIAIKLVFRVHSFPVRPRTERPFSDGSSGITVVRAGARIDHVAPR